MAKAEELAKAFEQANDEVIAACESCSEADWGKVTSEEQWSIGVLAHHLAGGHQIIAGLAVAMGSGQVPDVPSMEKIHENNAAHAKQFAKVGKTETLELLRSNGAQAAEMVRGMSDEQLAKTAVLAPVGADPVSAQFVIEGILIGTIQGHMKSFNATVR